MTSTIRSPAVAGRFYPGSPDELRAAISTYVGMPGPGEPCLGLMAPHAGYMFSGSCAGAGYARVRVPETVVVLSPNHTGRGARAAVWPGGPWHFPGASVAIDEPLRERLLMAAPLLTPDERAHQHEHSLEVQLPFLWLRQPAVRMVPITLADLGRDECLELGQALARVIADGPPVLIVASSDMSHYIPAATAAVKDRRALDRMVALDPRGLYEVVTTEHLSMCGFVPATVMLAAATELGARAAEVVKYTHSGEVSGDYEAVVGYASVVVRS